jgi:AraC-like DNA-binding protein
VVSVAFHNKSIWARQRHGSLLFKLLDDSSAAYLDLRGSDVDSRNARTRLVMRLPEYVRPGLWTVSAFVRDQNAICSPIVSESFLVEEARPFNVLPLVVAALVVAAFAALVLWAVRRRHPSHPPANRMRPADTSSIGKQDPGESAAYSHRGRIESARNYIQENFAEDISPTDVARHCSISADWLGKVFKTNTGMTVVQYLTHVRLEQACTLLRRSDKNISEIAYTVGYKNPNYFSKAFAKHTGLPPRDFRKKYRGL